MIFSKISMILYTETCNFWWPVSGVMWVMMNICIAVLTRNIAESVCQQYIAEKRKDWPLVDNVNITLINVFLYYTKFHISLSFCENFIMVVCPFSFLIFISSLIFESSGISIIVKNIYKSEKHKTWSYSIKFLFKNSFQLHCTKFLFMFNVKNCI